MKFYKVNNKLKDKNNNKNKLNLNNKNESNYLSSDEVECLFLLELSR